MTGAFWRVVVGLILVGCCSFGLAQAAPGFDCSKATVAAEKTVCSDNGLAELDVKLTMLYKSAAKTPALVADQKKWIAERNACGNTHDCIEAAYQRRIVALGVLDGQLTTQFKAKLDCGAGKKPLSAAFYNGTAPASAVLNYGGEQAVLLVAMSGSGSRYTAPGMEYWEHQGEAAVTWHGEKMTCKVVR